MAARNESSRVLDHDRGARIRSLKERHDYSWQRIADEVGVSLSAVEKWSRGGKIAWPHLARLAEVLETTSGYIWTGQESEKADPVEVLRDRVDQLDGRLAQEGGRPYALRRHDEHMREEITFVRSELKEIRERLGALTAVLPDLVAETRELRAVVAELRQPGAGHSQPAGGS